MDFSSIDVQLQADRCYIALMKSKIALILDNITIDNIKCMSIHRFEITVRDEKNKRIEGKDIYPGESIDEFLCYDFERYDKKKKQMVTHKSELFKKLGDSISKNKSIINNILYDLLRKVNSVYFTVQRDTTPSESARLLNYILGNNFQL